MNRLLVEQATHPAALEALTGELEKLNAGWREARQDNDGQKAADAYIARSAIMPWGKGFDDEDFAFPMNERIVTRLGADDILVTLPEGARGPFGREVQSLIIPRRWLPGLDLTGELVPQTTVERNAALKITLGDHELIYDAFGLRKLSLAPCLSDDVKG